MRSVPSRTVQALMYFDVGVLWQDPGYRFRLAQCRGSRTRAEATSLAARAGRVYQEAIDCSLGSGLGCVRVCRISLMLGDSGKDKDVYYWTAGNAISVSPLWVESQLESSFTYTAVSLLPSLGRRLSYAVLLYRSEAALSKTCHFGNRRQQAVYTRVQHIHEATSRQSSTPDRLLTPRISPSRHLSPFFDTRPAHISLRGRAPYFRSFILAL